MARIKLFHVTSTEKGPFERGTHCISSTDHGYFIANSPEEVQTQLNGYPINLQDRDVQIGLVSRRLEDREEMKMKLIAIREEMEMVLRSIKAIDSWFREQ